MTTDGIVAAIGAALADRGYEVGPALLDGLPVMVGRRSQFRLRWLATRLHTFVVAARFDPSPDDPAMLDRFLDLSSRYASAHKGGLPRGLQTGTAAVAVAVVDGARDAALRWADHPHGTRFAALTYPVTADVATGRVTHPHRMVVGAMYHHHLRAIATGIVAPALRP